MQAYLFIKSKAVDSNGLQRIHVLPILYFQSQPSPPSHSTFDFTVTTGATVVIVVAATTIVAIVTLGLFILLFHLNFHIHFDYCLYLL